MWQPGLTLEEMEKRIILAALRFYRGDKPTTATALGISLRTMYLKLAKYEGKNVGNDGD